MDNKKVKAFLRGAFQSGKMIMAAASLTASVYLLHACSMTGRAAAESAQLISHDRICYSEDIFSGLAVFRTTAAIDRLPQKYYSKFLRDGHGIYILNNADFGKFRTEHSLDDGVAGSFVIDSGDIYVNYDLTRLPSIEAGYGMVIAHEFFHYIDSVNGYISDSITMNTGFSEYHMSSVREYFAESGAFLCNYGKWTLDDETLEFLTKIL